MTTTMLFYLTMTILLGFSVALFQYKPWFKSDKIYWVLSVLRALSIAALLLLLFNPKINLNFSRIIKPKLNILLDNTQSIKFLNKDKILDSVYNILISNKTLNEKFDIESYTFDKDLNATSRLDFKAPQTNLGKSLQTLNEIQMELYRDDQAAAILISDGNQTIGSSYLYNSNSNSQPVFPLMLGDSTAYLDLKIQHLNVNKYTFLGNIFPVEVFVNYNVNRNIRTDLRVYSANTLVAKKTVSLTPKDNSQSIEIFLKANKIGLQSYRLSLDPLLDEKLTTNNFKEFGIEVIDQQIKIALISDSSHPDLGAFKSMISTQKNYSIELLSPASFLDSAEDYTIAILYQPNSNFSRVYDLIKNNNINTFTVGGTHTDWGFLNNIQTNFKQEITQQYESFQAFINPNFDAFALDAEDFEKYPPLKSVFGATKLTGQNRILLYKSINNLSSQQPLLFSFESNGSRHIVLLAENIWKWRLYVYRQQQLFKKVDDYFMALFKYLSTQQSADRLRVNHESIFDGSTPIVIYAQYFGVNFEFNRNANIEIEITSKDLEATAKFPMLLENNTYAANLESLKPGSYSYKVRLKNKEFSKAGRFEILPYNIESQFLNADISKLRELASQTKAKAFYDFQTEILIQELTNNKRFKSIQKVEKKSVPLIHFKWLLLILIFSLASEWFLRKYNGLI